MLSWVKKSFARKVTVLLVVGGFVIISTYAYLDYLKEEKQYTDILITQTEHLTETLALLVDDNVRYEKYYELWDQLREIYKNNQKSSEKGVLFYIREIYVVNLDGDLLGHTDVKNHPLKTKYVHNLLKSNPFPKSTKRMVQSKWYDKNKTLMEKAPLVFGGDLVGYIFLDFDPAPLSELKKDLLVAYLGYQVVATLVIIFFSLLFARWIASPLMNINKILENIGSGEVKLKELTKRQDEYKALGIAIENTDQRIAQNHKELISQHDTIRADAARLAAILDTTVDGIVNISRAGMIKNINRAVTRIFGYDESELIGKNVTILMPEKYRQAHLSKIAQVSNPEQSENFGKILEYEGLAKDGRQFPIDLSIGYWKSDKEYQYTGVIRDITARKHAELELNEYRDNLENLVARRTQELEFANKELESFSYSVTHDLRAPLRSIDGFSLVLLEDYSAMLDDTGRNYLKRVRNSTQRMSELINDILDLSRISQYKINKQSIDLSLLVNNIKNDIEERYPHKQASWILAENIFAYADEKLVRIILENLIGNAWKYSSKKELPEIEFGERLIEDEKVYFVKDNGAGFDMKYAKKLFGAFQRLHGQEEFDGTGIGLATVKRIMQRHGGRIWAHAEVDKGATFFFTFGGDA